MSYQAGLSSCGGEFYSILFAYFVSTGKEPRTWCARQMLYIENIPSPRVIFSGFLILCPFDRIYIYIYTHTFIPKLAVSLLKFRSGGTCSVSIQPTGLRQNVL